MNGRVHLDRVAELRGIWGRNGLSITERAVLGCLLVQSCDDKPAKRTRSCCSYRQIAALTGRCERSVGRAHRSLRAQGVLVDVRQRGVNEVNPGAYEVGFDLSRIPSAHQRADRAAIHERAAIVAWLQAIEDDGQGSTWQWADAIARGEHVADKEVR